MKALTKLLRLPEQGLDSVWLWAALAVLLALAAWLGPLEPKEKVPQRGHEVSFRA